LSLAHNDLGIPTQNGDVVLNVNARKLTVERNDRFEDYTTTTNEV